MNRRIISDKIKKYNKNYTLELGNSCLMKVNKLEGRYHDKLITLFDTDNNIVTCGVSKGRIYMFSKDLSDPNKIIAVLLFHPKKPHYNEDVISTFISYDINRPLKIFKLSFNDTKEDAFELSVMTEGFKVDTDGNIKFTLSPKKSYMDMYDECHKQLIMNWENNNIDGVKSNLAYLFTLINVIERKHMHKKNKTKEDAIRARMFAINDFKNYIKKLKLKEPNFNFTEYYKESDHDKLVLKITKDTIVGLRKLFQMIMMTA
jgi:hypothetical protein